MFRGNRAQAGSLEPCHSVDIYLGAGTCLWEGRDFSAVVVEGLNAGTGDLTGAAEGLNCDTEVAEGLIAVAEGLTGAAGGLFEEAAAAEGLIEETVVAENLVEEVVAGDLLQQTLEQP